MGRRRLGVVAPWFVLGVAGCFGGGDDWLPPPSARAGDAGDASVSWPFVDAGEGVDTGLMMTSSQPVFGPTVTASRPPPPISGGTLLVSRDGTRAFAADPDRDALYVIDLAKNVVSATVAFGAGDEPGRLAEDGSGRVHVALRGGGALVTIDAAGNVLARRSVCPAPRGVSWDSSTDRVWVACATGELVALPSSGGSAIASLVVERDLRDVVASNGTLSVSQFRSARVLRVAQDGTVTRRDQLPSPSTTSTPQVAWRAVPTASGAIATVHQIESSTLVAVQPGGYGTGPCNGEGPPLPPPDHMPVSSDAGATCPPDAIDPGCLAKTDAVVKSVLTVIQPDGTVAINRVIPASVPVDVAVSRDGSAYAVVAAGNAFTPSIIGTVLTFDSTCGNLRELPRIVSSASLTPVAVAFDAQNDVVVQTREPAALWRFHATGAPTQIALSNVSRADTGVDIFHTQAGAMVACASCHPEGGDDGHVWLLDGNARRTPSLRGTIAGTAPYHWRGDEANLGALVVDVYTERMSGAFLASDQSNALTGWVQTIPAPPAPSWLDGGAIARGQTVFQNASCGTCHSGTKMTNNLSTDVGTGGFFQVPPLVGVGWRTPLLHDGCAATILDRFGKCGTPDHGATSSLSSGDIADLATFLESL